MAFSPPVLGCLVKKGLQKGGSRAPQDRPGYALAKYLKIVNFSMETLKLGILLHVHKVGFELVSFSRFWDVRQPLPKESLLSGGRVA